MHTTNSLIILSKLIDQASEFTLDPAGVFVLKRWERDSIGDKPFWIISNTWSYAQFLNMKGEWVNEEDNKDWLDTVLWSDPLAAATFYYGWRSRFYWVYVKGAGDRRWHHDFFSEDPEKAKNHYFAFQLKMANLHWMLMGPDRKIIREDIGSAKQKWLEYPLNLDPSVYLEKS